MLNSLRALVLETFEIKIKWQMHSVSSLLTLQTLTGVHRAGPDEN